MLTVVVSADPPVPRALLFWMVNRPWFKTMSAPFKGLDTAIWNPPVLVRV